MSSTADTGISQEELSLRLALRRLWSDHVIWTREYVVAAVAGAPVSERLTRVSEGLVEAVGTAIGGVITPLSDGDAAAVRLLKNQEDLVTRSFRSMGRMPESSSPTCSRSTSSSPSR
jgi:hypothetical protein